MTNIKGGAGETRAQERNQNEAPSDAGKRTEDARSDPAQQEKNREEMGVTPEHKTQDMERGKRGTFP